MMENLLTRWNIDHVVAINPTLIGGGKTWIINTVTDDYVLKASDLMHSEREFKYLHSLSMTKLPVALPILTSDGNWYVGDENRKVYCLYPKLHGEVVLEHYRGDATRRANHFGQAIGFLHVCLSQIEVVNESREMQIFKQVQDWAIPVITRGNQAVDVSSVERIWRDVETDLATLTINIPKQLIHRDAHPSNMLFEKGRLTGFLDFELVTRGLRLFDVCYCGSSILIDGFEDSEKGNRWPLLFQSLIDGYQEFCVLTPLERQNVYAVLVAVEFIFLAFWLENDNADRAIQVTRLLSWLEKNKDMIDF